MHSNSIAKGKQIQVQKVQCGAAGLIFYFENILSFSLFFLILLTAPAEWEKSGKKKKSDKGFFCST
jgi:hypothetical protein